MKQCWWNSFQLYQIFPRTIVRMKSGTGRTVLLKLVHFSLQFTTRTRSSRFLFLLYSPALAYKMSVTWWMFEPCEDLFFHFTYRVKRQWKKSEKFIFRSFLLLCGINLFCFGETQNRLCSHLLLLLLDMKKNYSNSNVHTRRNERWRRNLIRNEWQNVLCWEFNISHFRIFQWFWMKHEKHESVEGYKFTLIQQSHCSSDCLVSKFIDDNDSNLKCNQCDCLLLDTKFISCCWVFSKSIFNYQSHERRRAKQQQKNTKSKRRLLDEHSKADWKFRVVVGMMTWNSERSTKVRVSVRSHLSLFSDVFLK